MGRLPSAVVPARCPVVANGEHHGDGGAGQVASSGSAPSRRSPIVPDVHREIERKFDVDPGFALPGLTDVDGVAGIEEPEERRLEAVYHDTADLRLARAAVTMRR